MSRELDAMQFVLDLLTDGIITSAVQQIGFTPHDKITEPELPFVQVYSPVEETQEQAVRQPPGVLTFQLDILDAFGNSDVLRDAIAALDETFRIDNTFQGIVKNAFITLRSVAERRADERSVVGAVVTVEIAEGAPNPNFTSVLVFDDETIFSTSAGIVKENSKYVAGVLGLRKIGLSGGGVDELVSSLTADSGTGYPGFPMDLSGTNRLRALVYVNSDNSVMGSVQLRLHSSFNINYSTYNTNSLGGNGWQFPSFDLTDPVAPDTGSGASLASIQVIEIRFGWTFFADYVSPTYGLLVGALGYVQRDTGDNNGRGVHPGF
jgi:hypothetical protein